MADPNKPPNSDEDALSNLRRRVDAQPKSDKASAPPDSPASLAVRFGGEFGAAIIVGALLGIGIDHFVHTSPWGVLIGTGLGFVTGVVNIVRTAQSFNRANPPDANARSVPDDDD
jgi:ATP synthase protein I